MSRLLRSLSFVTTLAVALPSVAITPSNDLLIAGAARTNRWTSDLYINNPGQIAVSVDVMWLERGQGNTSPDTQTVEVGPDETLVLDDALRNLFGMNRAEGALRILTTGGAVTANLIVFTGAGSEGGTYGSGFEAIPASAATSVGEMTTLTGMVLNNDFYTNLFALGGANGATMELDLLDPDGQLLDTAQVVLEAYEPWLSQVGNLWDVASFENGTALVRVRTGSAVILGSKIDTASNDPTTLEQAFGRAGDAVDGTYQFSLYDSLYFASGGNLVIAGGQVTAINGTYVNFDKVDPVGEPECPLIFQWGFEFAATGVENFTSGAEFTDSYADGGEITWTVTFTIDANLGFTGRLDATGAGFTGVDEGCNGDFPPLLFEGGKSE